VPPRGCGGIGRRARFRSVWGQPRGGSSPLIRMASSVRLLAMADELTDEPHAGMTRVRDPRGEIVSELGGEIRVAGGSAATTDEQRSTTGQGHAVHAMAQSTAAGPTDDPVFSESPRKISPRPSSREKVLIWLCERVFQKIRCKFPSSDESSLSSDPHAGGKRDDGKDVGGRSA
jgi:hypothetical protein